MFEQLSPLVAQRGVHLMLTHNSDGTLNVYVEPVRLNDDEDVAFSTPLRLTGTPVQLDAELPALLGQWVEKRSAVTTTLAAQLEQSTKELETAAAAAKKAAQDKVTAKKNASATKAAPKSASVAVASPTPTLLDELGTDDDGTSASPEAASPAAASTAAAATMSAPTPEAIASAPSAVAAATVTSSETIELF